MSASPLRVDDGAGYVLTLTDLAFVRVDADDLAAVHARTRPLGTTPGSFGHFLRGLAAALADSGVHDADVRLQGSAANVFSGPHKRLPHTRDDIFDCMRRLLDRIPEDFEIDDALAQMSVLWPPGSSRPQRPFFDLLHALRIDAAPSDIDVQISSDELMRRAEALAAARGVSTAALRVKNAHYGFLEDDVVEVIAWQLLHWADDLSVILRRPVAVKVFDGAGPDDVRADPSAVTSSHFQDHDWVLTPQMDAS